MSESLHKKLVVLSLQFQRFHPLTDLHLVARQELPRVCLIHIEVARIPYSKNGRANNCPGHPISSLVASRDCCSSCPVRWVFACLNFNSLMMCSICWKVNRQGTAKPWKLRRTYYTRLRGKVRTIPEPDSPCARSFDMIFCIEPVSTL